MEWDLLAKSVPAVPKRTWLPVAKLLGVPLAIDSIARELRSNAQNLGDENVFLSFDARANMRTEAWSRYRRRLHLLERVEPRLWHDVADAVERLDPAWDESAPTPVELEKLAERLENAP